MKAGRRRRKRKTTRTKLDAKQLGKGGWQGVRILFFGRLHLWIFELFIEFRMPLEFFHIEIAK